MSSRTRQEPSRRLAAPWKMSRAPRQGKARGQRVGGCVTGPEGWHPRLPCPRHTHSTGETRVLLIAPVSVASLPEARHPNLSSRLQVPGPLPLTLSARTCPPCTVWPHPVPQPPPLLTLSHSTPTLPGSSQDPLSPLLPPCPELLSPSQTQGDGETGTEPPPGTQRAWVEGCLHTGRPPPPPVPHAAGTS